MEECFIYNEVPINLERTGRRYGPIYMFPFFSLLGESIEIGAMINFYI